MLTVKYPVVVEGRYDKIKLDSLIIGTVITTDGYDIFTNKEKLELLRRLAREDKIILLTDADRAGFRIRSYLTGALPPGQVIHVYIPQLKGKEPRKAKASAEGTLGVEGISAEVLRQALIQAGVTQEEPAQGQGQPITKMDLYRLGLSGREGSGDLRRRLLVQLSLPVGISANLLPDILSRLMTITQLEEEVDELQKG